MLAEECQCGQWHGRTFVQTRVTCGRARGRADGRSDDRARVSVRRAELTEGRWDPTNEQQTDGRSDTGATDEKGRTERRKGVRSDGCPSSGQSD